MCTLSSHCMLSVIPRRLMDAMSEDADGIDQQNDAAIRCHKRFLAAMYDT